MEESRIAEMKNDYLLSRLSLAQIDIEWAICQLDAIQWHCRSLPYFGLEQSESERVMNELDRLSSYIVSASKAVNISHLTDEAEEYYARTHRS